MPIAATRDRDPRIEGAPIAPGRRCELCGAALVRAHWYFELCGQRHDGPFLTCSRWPRCRATGILPEVYNVGVEEDRPRAALSLDRPPPPLSPARRRMAEAGLSLVHHFVVHRLWPAMRERFGGEEECLSIGHTLAVLVAANRVSERDYRRNLLAALRWTFFGTRRHAHRLPPLLSLCEEADPPAPRHHFPGGDVVAADLEDAIRRRLHGRPADVFPLLVQRMSLAEIAERLGVTRSAIAFHVEKIRAVARAVMGGCTCDCGCTCD